MEKENLIRIERNAKKEIESKINEVHGRINEACVTLESKCEPHEIEREVLRQYHELLKNEGPDKCFQCAEWYNGIDISEKLSMIRADNKENALLLAVYNNQITDELIVEGNNETIPFENYRNVGAFEFVRKWAIKGAEILNYHNHSNRFAAVPSLKDIIVTPCKQINISDWTLPKTEWLILWSCATDDYEGAQLSSFQYADWGVVTEIDFFSAAQRRIALEQILLENGCERKHKAD